MRIVVVDDDRILQPPNNGYVTEVVHLRSSAEALDYLRALGPEEAIYQLWLDHDLGRTDTVRPVVNALEEDWETETNLYPTICQIVVHSGNPVAFDWIRPTADKICPNKCLRVNAHDYIVGFVYND